MGRWLQRVQDQSGARFEDGKKHAPNEVVTTNIRAAEITGKVHSNTPVPRTKTTEELTGENSDSCGRKSTRQRRDIVGDKTTHSPIPPERLPFPAQEMTPDRWESLYRTKVVCFTATGLSRKHAEARASRQVKALLVEHMNFPPPESWLDGAIRRARRGACFVCGSWRFWESIHGVARCAACHPPARERLVQRWIGRKPPSGLKEEPAFIHPFTRDAIVMIDAIREQAISLGWSRDQLYRNRSCFRFPCGQDYGLVCFLHSGRLIGKVTRENIEILIPSLSTTDRSLLFPNRETSTSKPIRGATP